MKLATILILFILLWFSSRAFGSDEKEKIEKNSSEPLTFGFTMDTIESPNTEYEIKLFEEKMKKITIPDVKSNQESEESSEGGKILKMKQTDKNKKESFILGLHSAVLFKIFYEFLTLKEVLERKSTCKAFDNLIRPANEKKTRVLISKNIHGSGAIEINLEWVDLCEFLKENINNILINHNAMPMIQFQELKNIYIPEKNKDKIISWYLETMKFLPKLDSCPNQKISWFTQTSETDSSQFKIWNRSNVSWIQLSKNRELIYTGGHKWAGGKIRLEVNNPLMICATISAFAILQENGNVITFGNEHHGGKVPVGRKLEKIKMICATNNVFAALFENGNVFTWGQRQHEALLPYQMEPKNIKMIFSIAEGFALLTHEGNVLSWGTRIFIPRGELKNVVMVYTTNFAFVALLECGSLFAWGNEHYGGLIPEDFRKQLENNVADIEAGPHHFKAICKDGEEFIWPMKTEYV